MTPKEKAVELVNKYSSAEGNFNNFGYYQQCALIAVENEYYSLKEQLFDLKACGVIESNRVYLKRMQFLIDEELQVKQEIEKL